VHSSPSPAVRCLDCDRHWNSVAMAEGLAAIGSCPRCGGTLEFRETAQSSAASVATASDACGDLAPHLVLGIPRR
jgi:uncharacterized paraquat-inducible protein A